MSNPFASNSPAPNLFATAPTSAPPGPAFGSQGQKEDPPRMSMGSGNLMGRVPQIMSDYVAYRTSHPAAPAEQEFLCEFQSASYVTKQDGDPLYIAKFRVLQSNCEVDPVGVDRCVFMSGSRDKKKGGLQRLWDQLLEFHVALVGIDPVKNPEQLATLRHIIDDLAMVDIVQKGVAVGQRFQAIGRVVSSKKGDGKQFVNYSFRGVPGTTFDDLVPSLKQACIDRIKALG